MTELSLREGKSAVFRYVSTAIFVAILITTIVFNGLAGPGIGPFSQSTGEISARHEVCLTPAGYTFAIWGLIYFLLILIAIYAIVITFRKVGFDTTWELGGAVSVPFLLVLSLNLILNIGWLFAWDADNMIASFVLLLLIAATNTTAFCLSAYSFGSAASRLLSTSKVDFWMGASVLNAHAVYDMWTTIAALVNLGILVDDVARDEASDIKSVEEIQNKTCIGILSILLIGFIVYFVLEQTVLKRFMNLVFTHYLVYIWALAGIFVSNCDRVSSEVRDLIISNISFGIAFVILRLTFLTFRNRQYALYKTI